MARSVWKGPFVDGYLLKKAEKSRGSGRNEVIKTWSRRSTILPQFVGLTFGVYNGHKFMPVLVTENMIGHKFGEFSPTRTFHGHAADKKAREELTMSKPSRRRRLEETRPRPSLRDAAHQPAQAEPGGAVDPRQERRDGAGRADLLASAASRSDVRKVLQAAIANAENNHQLDVDRLYVAEATVGRGFVMKRFHARARGRAARIEKPLAQLTVVVRESARRAGT